MPVPHRSTNPKAEAKYNVSTEFPNLGLHSAAATGNVGLVEYALSNGQPVNSVLDGVLPLHAACAGGNEQVVKVLLDHGADVNAPRLPRKYSNERNRDGSAPIVGTSGSTPLHFASANGNIAIVSLLLLKGGHAGRADKHGVTPEMLARQNGWPECAELLKTWVLNKDKDLRERPRRTDSEGSESRTRIQVKRSIDNALNMLKASGSNLAEAYYNASPSAQHIPLSPSPPASPASSTFPQSAEPKQLGEYTFYPVSPSDDGRAPLDWDPNARRPSLPHIGPGHQTLSPDPPHDTKHQRRRHHRRPRSAGNDAEPEPMSSIAARTNQGRRLATKYSFMNLFNNKKGCESPQPSALSASLSQASASNISLHAGPSSSTTSLPRQRHRMGSDAARQGSQSILSSTLPPSPPQSPTRPPVPLAVDLHNALAHNTRGQHTRDRSASGSSSKPVPIPSNSGTRSTFETSSTGSWGSASPGSHQSSSPIARLAAVREQPRPRRDRSTSRASRDGAHANESGYASSAMRALRFDSNSSTGAMPRSDFSPSRVGLRGSTSASSLSRSESPASRARRVPDSAPPGISDFDVDAIEEDEDDDDYYGRPLDTPHHARPNVRPIATVINRGRGDSFASIDSLSPILSADLGAAKLIKSDFPFSLDDCPVSINEETYPPSTLLSAGNLRPRGDSLSSMGTNTTTDDSQLLSASGISSNGSNTITSPSLLGMSEHRDQLSDVQDHPPLKEGEIGIVVRSETGEPSLVHVADTSPRGAPTTVSSSLKARRPHTPSDLDLKSKAENEKNKLQRAQQNILDLAKPADTIDSLETMPLSARLAAYGEALERQRKVTNQEGTRQPQPNSPVERSTKTSPKITRTRVSSGGSSKKPPIPPRSPHRPEPVNRQLSLEAPTLGRVLNRPKMRRRPHTSQGDDGTQPLTFSRSFGALERGTVNQRHHPRSASAIEVPPVVVSTDEKDDDDDSDVPPTATDSRRFVTSPITPMAKRPITPKSSNPRHVVADDSYVASRMTSLDLEADSDLESIGVPLTRVCTAPHSGGGAVSKMEKARTVAQSHKLARMGFPSEVATTAGGSYRSPSALALSNPSSKRFGGLKSWFKGGKAV